MRTCILTNAPGENWQEQLIEWLGVVLTDAGVNGDQYLKVMDGMTDVLVNHFGDD